MDLYSTFNNIGVTIKPESDYISYCSNLTYCVYDEITSTPINCKKGLEFTKVERSWFATSILWLEHNTIYNVSARCYGSTTTMFSSSVRTQKGFVYPTVGGVESRILKELYVSPNGEGINCTFEYPCAVEEAVVNQLEPGTKVIFLEGVYYKYKIFPKEIFPNATYPVLFEGIDRKNVIFDGSKRLEASEFTVECVGSAMNQDCNVSTIYKLYNISKEFYKFKKYGEVPSYYNDLRFIAKVKKSTGEIQRLMPYKSYQKMRELKYNDVGFYRDNDTLYLNLKNEPIEDYYFIYTAWESVYLFRVDHTLGSHYYFFNMTFRYYGNFPHMGVIGLGASYCWVKNCIFSHNLMSVYFYNGANSWHNLIEYNEFYDSKYGMDWHGIKNYAYLERSTIRFVGGLAGKMSVIRYNIFHDNFDGATLVEGNKVNETREMDFHNNYIYNIEDDLIELDGLSSNVRVYSNFFEHCFSGISVAPALFGPTFIFNNIFLNMGIGTYLDDWTQGCMSALKTGYGIVQNTGAVYFYHNLIIPNRTRSCGLSITWGDVTWDLMSFRNNIIFGERRAWTGWCNDDGHKCDIDYNAYYIPNTTADDSFIVKMNGDEFSSVSDFHAMYSEYAEHGVQLSTNDIFNVNSYVARDDPELLGQLIHGFNSDRPHHKKGLLFDVHRLCFDCDQTSQAVFPWALFLLLLIPLVIVAFVVLFGIITLIVVLVFWKKKTSVEKSNTEDEGEKDVEMEDEGEKDVEMEYKE